MGSTEPVEEQAVEKVSFVNAEKDGRFSFYLADGSEVVVGSKAYETDDPMQIAYLDSVEFARRWDRGWRGQGGVTHTVIGFNVPSREAVDRIYADLTGAGYTGQQPPYDAFWGARYAVVEDPDGNPVGLMSPLDPASRSTPPEP